MKVTEINVFSENTNERISIDQKKYLNIAKKIFKFYSNQDFFSKSALADFEYNVVSFDILYCNNDETHRVNVEYRNKDYIADIITFAIFADSEDKFVIDNEVYLGEILISLDKVEENSKNNSSSFEYELSFLISHGIMHLLGFEHQTMEDYNFVINSQKEALNFLKIFKNESDKVVINE